MVGINKINIKLLTAALVSIVVIGGSIIFTNALSTDSTFAGSIILGSPNNNSITANITANVKSDLYLEWGSNSNSYSFKSLTKPASELIPAVIVMNGLAANKAYYYRLYFKASGSDTFLRTREYTFRTPRAIGSDYTFVVQSDSHLLNKADKNLYTQSMETMAGYSPDFMFDLGDAFLNDQDMVLQNPNYETIRKTSYQQRAYFDIVTRSAPLFLTIGNHEGEYGINLDDTSNNMTAMSTLARKTYYPNPVPDGFYTGNTEVEAISGQPENYYAFQWGDALYVSIDPYRYSTVDPYSDKDPWEWSMGKTQYDWFRKTLESSTAKYKFVFSHHAIGNFRGGADVANLYEWGGYDNNGTYLFDSKRPGWGKPIQKVMEDTGVTIFFQGHDHLFSREVVGGVVYQTLPKPAEKIPDNQSNYNSYTGGDTLMNSGFLKIDVSLANVQVNYYRNYFVSTGTQSGNTGIVYSYTVDTNHKITTLKSTTDDLSTYGNAAGATVKKSGGKGNKAITPTAPSLLSVSVDGKVVAFDSPPFIDVSGRTQVPVRFIAEQLGCEVLWEVNNLHNTVTIKKDQTTINLKIGEKVAYLNGKAQAIDTAAFIKDGRTFVPVRFVSEILGAQVDWDGAGNKVIITTGSNGNAITAGSYPTGIEGIQSSADYSPKSVGKAFTFTVQADSHRDENSDLDLYQTTLNNVLSENPDFHIDLGDTFMSEKLAKTESEAVQRYLEDKSYFSKIMAAMPLFLVNGNHEGENGWDMGSTINNVANWASAARLKYFPNPIPDKLYSGSADGKGNYYSYNWGDATFIVLDPFWFTQVKAQGETDGWNYSLGKTQYDWLKATLENSHSKYKFVFVHNLVGGYGKDSRGGIEAASLFEWGGNNFDGSYGFDKMRPGWGEPIHELLVQNNVTAVFHGHDHFYAKQELDGIIYQLVPQPSHPGTEIRNAAEYGYKSGLFLPSSGHLKVTVSSGSVKVDYIKASLTSIENGVIANSYTILP